MPVAWDRREQVTAGGHITPDGTVDLGDGGCTHAAVDRFPLANCSQNTHYASS
jgi:hypothetical protein